MPAHINYETTPVIFYRFICENPEISSCYVGHTTNFLQRRRQHKHACLNEKSTSFNLKIYKIIRENGGWDFWKMVEIERRICLDKIDACKIEQQFIELYQSDMNGHFAHRNQNEYAKQYYLNNKEQIDIYRKQHCNDNIEHYKTYRLNHKLINKDYYTEQNKQYREKNKIKIAKRSAERFNCECGGKYTYGGKSYHLKTLKHLSFSSNRIV